MATILTIVGSAAAVQGAKMAVKGAGSNSNAIQELASGTLSKMVATVFVGMAGGGAGALIGEKVTRAVICGGKGGLLASTVSFMGAVTFAAAGGVIGAGGGLLAG